MLNQFELKKLILPEIKNRILRILFKPLIAFFKAARLKSDLYHFHDPELIPVGVLLKIFGRKVVYDVHEDVSQQILHKEWIPGLIRKPLSDIFNKFEKFFASFFDGIITATPHILDKFSKVSYKEKKVCINNYPIVRKLEKNHIKKDWVLYIGGITKERSALEMVQSFNIKNHELILIGSIYPKELLKKMKREKNWKNVEYLQSIYGNEKFDYFHESKIGLCLLKPTKNYVDSLPVKILEYWERGLPVLASNFSYWKGFYGTYGGIDFVDPTSPDEIKNKLAQMLKNPNNLLEMGKKGREAVEKYLNWDAEFKKLLKFYDSILSK